MRRCHKLGCSTHAASKDMCWLQAMNSVLALEDVCMHHFAAYKRSPPPHSSSSSSLHAAAYIKRSSTCAALKRRPHHVSAKARQGTSPTINFVVLNTCCRDICSTSHSRRLVVRPFSVAHLGRTIQVCGCGCDGHPTCDITLQGASGRSLCVMVVRVEAERIKVVSVQAH